MVEWELRRMSDESHEQQHCWITRDGLSVDLEYVVGELMDYEEKIRALTDKLIECGHFMGRQEDEITRLREDCELYEAMKEGVTQRVSDLERENEQLRRMCGVSNAAT